MKLLIAIGLIFSISAFAQQGNSFKSLNKKQSGATLNSFPFITISNNIKLKSDSLKTNRSLHALTNLDFSFRDKNDSVKNLIQLRGTPIFFEKGKSTLRSESIESKDDQFYSFFNSTKATTKLMNPIEELLITQSTTDNLGMTHIKAQQFYKGIKIYGAESYLHIGNQKDIYTGRIFPVDTNIAVTPKITEENALNSVTADLKTRTVLKDFSKKEMELLKYNSPEVELIIYNGVLAYELVIRPNFIEEWKYFVDANDGTIISFYNNTKSDGPTTATAYDLNGVPRTINTYLENSSYLLVDASESMYNSATQEGVIMTLNANNTSTVNLNYSMITSTNNTWNIPSSVSAHYNATATYKYFKNTFGRNSINGQGGDIISFINVAEDDGSSMENAFWNGKAAFYGNGGSSFKPLAGALDVTAHELGHGVVSNTANLEYLDQSGAINETYADIFGAMVDRNDWLIGEDVTKTSFSPSGALRNMAEPHNMGSSLTDPYWQPNNVSEMYLGENDNGGVHTNSGIGNYAYYLFATAITKEKAEQVFYRALANYLTSKSEFIDFRIAVVQSAKDLYGNGSQEVSEANEAFDAVGIQEEEQIDYSQDYQVNPGQDYLITYSADPADQYSLYRSSTSGTSFYGLSYTSMKSKVSVTDDGSVAVFVSDDDKIRALYTDPADPQEFIVSSEAFWDNVAISKDGNRLAAISTEVDTAIYVYDFILKKWAKFFLYNPTTSENGANAGGVVFADAIEFDHTGEYLIYDAYNVLNSSTSTDIGYWDIGFIKVWDNSSNYFGDGTINKLFGSLPENISIGDPVFSKNSSNIIAFDYIDTSNKEYAILGSNLLTGKLGIITTNATVGYPTFSKNDDKIAFSALNTSDAEVVGVINLASDKITGSGSGSILVNGAKWPVFYATGNRNLALEPVTNFTVDIKSGNAPLSVRFIDLSINQPSSWSWSFPGGSPSTSSLQNPTVVYNSTGTYQVSLTSYNNAGNNNMTKVSYITVSTGTDIDEAKTKLFTFYPNPTTGKLYIQSDNDFRIKLYSTTGSLLFDVNNEKEIDLSSLKTGLYIIQFETGGKIITDKLIKQ